MDDASQLAAKLLNALAQCNSKLESLWRAIRTKAAVAGGSHRLEVRQYNGVGTIEGYVDVELKSGKAVCWWMEVSWPKRSWEISASIRVVDEQGQYDLLEFPKIQTVT